MSQEQRDRVLLHLVAGTAALLNALTTMVRSEAISEQMGEQSDTLLKLLAECRGEEAA
jgi:hypothetical protein